MSGQAILLVDDDPTFCQVLARAMRRRQLDVRVAHDARQGIESLEEFKPDFAVLDLKMDGPSGLSLIEPILDSSPDCKILMLTGYASVATAVAAVKLGAHNYLCKPADADQILAALECEAVTDELPEPAEKRLSVDRVEWEYIQQVMAANDGNISATARQLGMHRRTLQRKLDKHPVRE
ncbi:response regulator transcription factor [Parendozoicomonas haliclonae]|uniref:Photosynthetic apparatus regulatory protein RegA n=1 Tax=Parendozoicomonas haliclonae TaxID=1960125 RepID=A0A1X7AEA5_9GAMM|nr:response regulator [Parendozoicomonas haliclonae]SMA33758.1 Photosynthetic apparatus regulatory protein RegA [Parendozoicomonas haliclonae]